MSKRWKSGSLVTGLLLAAAGPAHADGFMSWQVCGGSPFATCAAVELSVVGTHVTMRTWNLSGHNGTWSGTLFSAIGLFNLPGNVNLAANPNFTMSGPVRTGDDPNRWRLVQDRTAGGIQLDLLGGAVNGIDDGIASGCSNPHYLPDGTIDLFMNPCLGDMTDTANWITFEFDVTNTWNPEETQLLIRGLNGQDGKTTECITGVNCFVVPTTTVPEPITTVLLGSGLAAVGLIRRRKIIA